MAKETLRLAIPSKGRLADPVAAFFRAAGAAIKFGGARDYRASLPAIPAITVQLMAAAEIAEALRAGDVHAGVTGEDLMHETLGGAPGDVPDAPICARRLGFGGARLVVAVPRAWIDVATMDDLAAAARQFRARHRRPLRVATKYVRLVRGFFARAGVVDYRIVGSTGATEAAPAAGLADLEAEVAELEGPRRREIAERIRAAREHGDLKENADYHIAKEDQAHLETKIQRLREREKNAVVVDVESAGADSFAFGRTAVLTDDSGRTHTWTLVGSTEANLSEGRLSAESPVGQALRNRKVGEQVKVTTPKGQRVFTIDSVS